nr:L-rhamnose mutarotase [uncultured Lichenicoccus sp.]
MKAASEKIAFRMQLACGKRAEYRARHGALWPELAMLLREAGISDSSIFLHEPSDSLLAVLRRTPDHGMDALPRHEIMRLWWRHMADIMQTDQSGAPITEPLPMLFHLD